MSVGISNSEYATKRRRLFDFLARVRAIGYDSILLLPLSVIDPHYSADVDVDIPAIAAIGWQSAGKSSLIEAISGITLPRASGTCTR
jgi:Dynamin family